VNTEVAVSTAVAELELGEAFTFDALVGAVQTIRGRRLRIVELSDVGEHEGLCALWLMRDEEDLVLHARTESALHRQQFVLHELAHMILGHDAAAVADPNTPDILLPDIPADTRRRLLRRQDLDTPEEVMAESLADRLAAAIRGSTMHGSRYLEVFG
jgi:hypothetical protein